MQKIRIVQRQHTLIECNREQFTWTRSGEFWRRDLDDLTATREGEWLTVLETSTSQKQRETAEIHLRVPK